MTNHVIKISTWEKIVIASLQQYNKMVKIVWFKINFANIIIIYSLPISSLWARGASV